ncbi:hypothetical protein BDN72DRAFT_906238 [Pluteus cervinus]|uniref:Uncharacterized protein n=1 Tax=Pluteus cervinus TaxID=181527 RepID=A0ACD3A0A7_9AGAR|nr:hypothetical protein BDN72DRAFT_906238 [Pluteus cervinus]
MPPKREKNRLAGKPTKIDSALDSIRTTPSGVPLAPSSSLRDKPIPSRPQDPGVAPAKSWSSNPRIQTRSRTAAAKGDGIASEDLGVGAQASGKKHPREDVIETASPRIGYDRGVDFLLRRITQHLAPEFVQKCEGLDLEDLLEDYIASRDKEFPIDLARLETELGLQSLLTVDMQIAHWQGVSCERCLFILFYFKSFVNPSFSSLIYNVPLEKASSPSGNATMPSSSTPRKPLSSIQSKSSADAIEKEPGDYITSATGSLTSKKTRRRSSFPTPSTVLSSPTSGASLSSPTSGASLSSPTPSSISASTSAAALSLSTFATALSSTSSNPISARSNTVPLTTTIPLLASQLQSNIELPAKETLLDKDPAGGKEGQAEEISRLEQRGKEEAPVETQSNGKGAEKKGKGKGKTPFHNYNQDTKGPVKAPAASKSDWSGVSFLFSAASCLIKETPLKERDSGAPKIPLPPPPTIVPIPLPIVSSSTLPQPTQEKAPYTAEYVQGAASPFSRLLDRNAFRHKTYINETLRKGAPAQDDPPCSKKVKLDPLLEPGEENFKEKPPVEKTKKKVHCAGKAVKERLALEMGAKEYRRLRVMRKTTYMQANGPNGFSLEADGLATSTGWQGRFLPKEAKDNIHKAYAERETTSELREVLQSFARAPYDKIGHYPLVLADKKGRIFFARSKQIFRMKKIMEKLCSLQDLLVEGITEQERGELDADNHRGDHYATIFVPFPDPTAPTASDPVPRFQEQRMAAHICCIRTIANDMVVQYFPGVAVRYQLKTEAWREKTKGKIRSMFGTFDNYCWNACFWGQERVQCKPHTDHKNVVGVWVVIIYELPGAHFDHKTRSWLVIWDAGIIVEAPPWTALIYPSSLFLHFNVDIQDIDVLTLDGDIAPTLEERERWEKSSKAGRGSIVFFNQASMFHIETGETTLTEANAKGLPSKWDLSSDGQTATKVGSQLSRLTKSFNTTHLPSPATSTISPTTSVRAGTGLSRSAPKANPEGLVPIKPFVHEAVRRSRASGIVLQMALCYLEAIWPKIPGLVHAPSTSSSAPRISHDMIQDLVEPCSQLENGLNAVQIRDEDGTDSSAANIVFKSLLKVSSEPFTRSPIPTALP